jgi:hypothetical protein
MYYNRNFNNFRNGKDDLLLVQRKNNTLNKKEAQKEKAHCANSGQSEK